MDNGPRTDRGLRTVEGTTVRIVSQVEDGETAWAVFGSEMDFATEENGPIGECWFLGDEPPTDAEVAELLRADQPGDVIHVCMCGMVFREGEEDMLVDHVKNCDLVDGAGQPI
jgi:hypothetical protein